MERLLVTMGVFCEHVKLGQRILSVYLVQLFNSVIQSDCIPSSFKLAIKIPVPKMGKALAYTFDDYRGISPIIDIFQQNFEAINPVKNKSEVTLSFA